MESTFSDAVDTIKNCYFNAPDQFKKLLNRTDLSITSGVTIQEFANLELKTNIGDPAYKNLLSTNQFEISDSRNTGLIEDINKALPENAPKIDTSSIPKYNVFIYGSNTESDFRNQHAIAHPSAKDGNKPDVFHAGNKFYVFCAEEKVRNREHRESITQQIKDAFVQANMELHCKSNNIDMGEVIDRYNSNKKDKPRQEHRRQPGHSETIPAAAPGGSAENNRANINSALSKMFGNKGGFTRK